MRTRVLPIAALTLVAVASRCGNGEGERQLEPGRIAVGALLSGRTEQLIAAGARVAAEELNNGGGVDGVARVDLVVLRPATRGDYAVATRSLIRRGMSAILLPCSKVEEVAAAIRSRAVLLAPCADRSSALPRAVFGTGLAVDDPAMLAKPIAGSKLDEFYERYKSLYGIRPLSSVPALGYDAVKVFAVAAERAGSRRPMLIEEQLRDGLELGGAFGKIHYEGGRTRPTLEVRNVGS